MRKLCQLTVVGISIVLASTSAQASKRCPISEQSLHRALAAAIVPTGGPSNGGLDFHMWASVVEPDGSVCRVAKSGDQLNDQWLGSRVISAQKAYTAIAFSKPDLALSTANLWAPTQPGGSLFGLQFSNPVDPAKAYAGDSSDYGGSEDAMIGETVGGVNVFGGGLALYNSNGRLIGAIGVSGDTSCADHNVAWRIRQALNMDNVPGGVGSLGDDNIVYDIDSEGNSTGGFGHPNCGFGSQPIAEAFPRAGQ